MPLGGVVGAGVGNGAMPRVGAAEGAVVVVGASCPPLLQVTLSLYGPSRDRKPSTTST